MFDQTGIKVFPTKMRVSCGCVHRKQSSSILSNDTSNVPPPKSKINTFCSPLLSKPYANEAATKVH